MIMSNTDSSERTMKAALRAGATFAGYRVEDLVGRGGMGLVYRATDLALGRQVALKLVAPELAEDAHFRARFLEESRIAASLDHPNIVPIYAAGEHEGQLFLAMRLVDGSDLKSTLEREGTLSPERSLDVLGPIAEALDAAHRRGLVHRDVKPANVLLDEDGHAYLTDFGITKPAGGQSTDTGRDLGTLDYLTPEQIRGDEVDARTDCYALGCVMYECLAGSPPFRRDTVAETLWAHMHEAHSPLADRRELDAVMERALAKQKEERYSSCGEFVSAAARSLGLVAPVVSSRRARAGRRLVVAGALALLVATTAVALLSQRGDETATARPVRPVPDSVAVVDPRSNRIVDQVRTPGRPAALAAAGRSVWVAGDGAGTVTGIGGRPPSVEKVIPARLQVSDIAASRGSVWLMDARRHQLVRLDEAYERVADRIALRGDPTLTTPGVAVGPKAVWAADGSNGLLEIDPRSGQVRRRIDFRVALDHVAVGEGSVWAISGSLARVFEIDPASGSISAQIPIGGRAGGAGPAPVDVAVGEGAVWVLNGNAPSLTRIDPDSAAVTDTVPLGVGSNPTALTTGAGAVWVTLSGEGSIARIDPASGRVRSIPVGGSPVGVAVAGGRVYASVQPGFRTELVDRGRPVRMDGAVDEPFCAPVEYAGRGAPELLIVSDLPLQVPRSSEQPLQFTDAIRMVLAGRGFRAGRYRVGYQSCDDSSVRTGEASSNPWTPATCRRNARAYAQARAVVGVIGPYNSGCGTFLLPVLNAARGGRLATVSSTATATGLTRDGPGALPGEPKAYQPSGGPNFARVVASDNVQGAAGAIMAERLGVRRLFVLDDGEPYGIGLAETVRRAADELGVELAGSAPWDFRARDYRELAARIERSGADGVFLGGYQAMNGDRLLRDLRAELGERVRMLAPDGFSEFRQIIEQAGPAAEDLYVTLGTLPVESLSPAGRRFAGSFGRALRGRIDPYAITTAQAADVLLDAISASDGTRASVTERLLALKVEDGILGSFAFDAYGDMTAPGITVYRIQRGTARAVTAMRPPARLVEP